jgi:L-alanine-DL-glutamate epimerase-like enolase superfamily enzyme
MRIENGHAIPSAAPGLGIAWDFDAIKAQTVSGSTFTIS